MLLVHFVRDNSDWKLKGGVLFIIYLQTLGDFTENDSLLFSKKMFDFRNFLRLIV